MNRITKSDLLKYLEPSATKQYIGSHIQTITIDEILNNLQKNELFDSLELFDMYLDAYPELKDSQLIMPNNIHLIQQGDMIKYSKSIDQLSCCCIVLRIKLVGQKINSQQIITEKELEKNINRAHSNAVVEYFLVRGFGEKPRIWKLYPENYYFFILPLRIYNKGKIPIDKLSAIDLRYIEEHAIKE